MSISCVLNAQTKMVNDANAKTRVISGSFTRVSVSSGVELYLTQGNETALAVSVSDSKYEERFKTEVVNGVLKIYYDNSNMTWKNEKGRKLKAYLSCKSLESIRGSAGARVDINGEFKADQMELSFSSGAYFTGKITSKSMTSDVNSGAQIKVAGQTGELTVSASSGAAFKGYDLVTQNTTASANSGASVQVEVSKALTASANSGGEIRYKGNATVTKSKVNSGGSVKQG